MTKYLFGALLLGSILACNGTGTTSNDGDGPDGGDSGADADTDADSDGDADIDAGGDADGGPDGNPDCKSPLKCLSQTKCEPNTTQDEIECDGLNRVCCLPIDSDAGTEDDCGPPHECLSASQCKPNTVQTDIVCSGAKICCLSDS